MGVIIALYAQHAAFHRYLEGDKVAATQIFSSPAYQPRFCSMSASASAATAKPFIVLGTSELTSSSTLGSSKCVVACTIARARRSASGGGAKLVESAMKIPEPTNTASAPRDRKSTRLNSSHIPL